ncbi:MAG TPA: cobalamin biosynthesis protein, partial [Pseudomonas sp.]|nr:cobalamin biosynthesis protein [Pseudomonas sp.]
MSLGLSLLAGVALDVALGEPRRRHPLVAFGRLANALEARFNAHGRGWRSHGLTAWCLAVLPLTLLAGWLVQ